MATDVLDVIRTKRDGGTLSDEQIRFFVEGYTAGTIADEQAAALCMAILLRDMAPGELATWTRAMIESGERLDLSSVGRPTVDKHSTGGVGDKVSLVLAPLVAACGAAVPQLSGRGLGHTGGTLDKLEAIPLIASSIMSKKIAEGTEALVLDVKIGSGAFLPALDQARRLAETMVSLGQAEGVRTVALITDMDAPLGRAAGNGLEVDEAIATLRGDGPPDLVEVTLALAREMVALAGLPAADAGVDPAAVLADGRALGVWDAMIKAQGGDPDADRPLAAVRQPVVAPASGYLRRLDARAVGVAVWRLGAGRSRKEDPVSPTAGAVCLRKPGDRVEAGEPVVELHADGPDRLAGALAALRGAIEIGPEPPDPRPLIVDRIG